MQTKQMIRQDRVSNRHDTDLFVYLFIQGTGKHTMQSLYCLI